MARDPVLHYGGALREREERHFKNPLACPPFLFHSHVYFASRPAPTTSSSSSRGPHNMLHLGVWQEACLFLSFVYSQIAENAGYGCTPATSMKLLIWRSVRRIQTLLRQVHSPFFLLYLGTGTDSDQIDRVDSHWEGLLPRDAIYYHYTIGAWCLRAWAKSQQSIGIPAWVCYRHTESFGSARMGAQIDI